VLLGFYRSESKSQEGGTGGTCLTERLLGVHIRSAFRGRDLARPRINGTVKKNPHWHLRDGDRMRPRS
jgi:hypothetical protein